MPQTFLQRVTLILPLVGIAHLLTSMVAPIPFAVLASGLAMVAADADCRSHRARRALLPAFADRR